MKWYVNLVTHCALIQRETPQSPQVEIQYSQAYLFIVSQARSANTAALVD